MANTPVLSAISLRHVIVTSAPKDYDYSYVVPIFEMTDPEYPDKTLRVVRIESDQPDFHFKYQLGRYASGLYLATTPDQLHRFRKQETIDALLRRGQ